MNQLLLDYFEQLVSRDEDVGKLNAAILQLAVQGKLVAQDPNDEPASELLKRIAAEKKRLKIKSEPLPEIGEEERPFPLPDGWEWVRLGELVSQVGSGSTPKGGKNVYQDTGIMFLRSQNVWNEGLRVEGVACISPKIHEKMKRTTVHPKDILLNITGASIGRSSLVPDDFDGGNVSQHVSIIRLVESETRHFVHKCIISPYFQTTIMDVQVGISREGLSKASLLQFPVPLPPLAEQKRIVERVDALLAQTRELESRLSQAETSLAALHETAVNTLLSATDPDDFAVRWQFIAENFDLLYDETYPETAVANIAQLKQAILQLAVQGKLTHQDPADEPARVLLERIAAEKKRLGIKSEKLPEIGEEERPFVLPDGWERVILPQVGQINPRNYAEDEMEVSFVPMALISESFGQTHESEIRTWGEIRSGFTHFQEDDVVVAKITPCFQNGKSAIMRNLKNGIGAGTTELYVFRRYTPGILPEYIYIFFNTPKFRQDGQNRMKGTAGQQRVPKDYILNVSVPVPPLAEQKRIVARVNSLLALCDELSAHLQAAQASRVALRDAVLSPARQPNA